VIKLFYSPLFLLNIIAGFIMGYQGQPWWRSALASLGMTLLAQSMVKEGLDVLIFLFSISPILLCPLFAWGAIINLLGWGIGRYLRNRRLEG